MKIIIKETQNTKGLYQIEVYDCVLNMARVIEETFFETEEFAEKYGREKFSYERTGDMEFLRVVMSGGEEAPEGTVLYGDANHPGDVYICPRELEGHLLTHMAEEGLYPYKIKGRWYSKDSFVCFVAENQEVDEGCLPIRFEWHDEPANTKEEGNSTFSTDFEGDDEPIGDDWDAIQAQWAFEDESENDKEFYRLEQRLLGRRVRE